ncbi:MAG: esterase-like protein [Frankiales bacterium]|nr:esterase-like protein [Frankiales bacterium]
MIRLPARTAACAALLGLLATGTASTAGTLRPVDRVEQVVIAPGDEVHRAARLAAAQSMLSLDTGEQPNPVVPGDDKRAACPPDRCRDHVVPVPTGVNVTSSKTRVIVPPGYAKSGRRYPVLYFFNGALSAYDQWTRSTNVVELSKRHPAIYVFPEGGYKSEAGFFSDWYDGSYQWETFHTQVLVPWIDRTYRTLPGARAAIGASMGSVGALGYAARHPGLFQSVTTISGFVDTQQAAASALPQELKEELGLPEAQLSRIWGNPVLQAGNWARHNPTALAARLRGTHLLITSGTGYASSSSAVHSGSMEQTVWTNHRTFLTALTAAGVDYGARFHRGGVHTWRWFVADLEWALPQVMEALPASR